MGRIGEQCDLCRGRALVLREHRGDAPLERLRRTSMQRNRARLCALENCASLLPCLLQRGNTFPLTFGDSGERFPLRPKNLTHRLGGGRNNRRTLGVPAHIHEQNQPPAAALSIRNCTWRPRPARPAASHATAQTRGLM